MKSIEFRIVRAGLIGAVLGSAGFVALGAFLIAQSKPVEVTVGVATVVTFGAFAVIGVKRLLAAPQVLRIGTDGVFTDAIPGLPAVLLRWEDLESIDFGTLQGQPILSFRLKDGIPVPPAINAAGKWVMDANQALVGTPLVVSPRAFVQDVSKIHEALEQFAPKS